MKNLPAIILLFIANSVSGIAQGISMIAIPWYFVSKEEMSTFGGIYIASSVVSLFWKPYCGTLVDKYDRKNIFLAVTLIAGMMIAGIAAVGYQWGDLPWFFVGAVFLITFFNYNIHYPNLYAFMQEITEEKYYGKITSYIEIQGQLSSVLAGAGAAMLLEGTNNGLVNLFGYKFNIGFNIAAWEIYEIFALDAATYFASFVIIGLISYTSLVDRVKESGNPWTQLKVGFEYLKNHKYLFLFGVASNAVFVSVLVTTFYIAATYVKMHLQEKGDVYAASEMYYAIGAVFAGVAIRQLFKNTNTPKAVLIMTTMTALLFGVLFLTKNVLLFYAMTFILGIANAGTRIMRVSYLFKLIPNQVYGRASGIFSLTMLLFRILFISLFSITFFQSSNNIIYAFGIVSAFLFLTVFILAKFYPQFVAQNQLLATQKPETTALK